MTINRSINNVGSGKIIIKTASISITLEEIPDNIKETLVIHPVRQIEEVWTLALQDPPFATVTNKVMNPGIIPALLESNINGAELTTPTINTH